MDQHTQKTLSPFEQELEEKGLEISKLMPYYPCLREVCHRLEPAACPAALFVGAALFGTLMTRCTYRFYHQARKLRRLNYCVFIIGNPATGKSFAERLYDVIADPIIKETKKGTNAINNYKRKRSRWEKGGCKGQGPEEPHVLIRTHPARTSNRVFIEDMMNAVETVDGQEMRLHMLSFDTELDNAINMQGEAWSNKAYLELKAFHNEEDGQFFKSLDATLCNFNVFWNFIYTGTPLALRHKVNEKNIGTGLATRLACIPMPKTHFRMMEFEEYNPSKGNPTLTEEEQTLSMWSERLNKVHGQLPIEQLVRYTYDWTKWHMEEAKEDDSEADEIMVKRVAYYGINVSVPFIVMRHWDEWQQSGTLSIDDHDLALCKLVMDIQFMCQQHFFWKYWEDYFIRVNEAGQPVMKRHTQVMRQRYAMMPDPFDVWDLMDFCGIQKRTAEKMIERWLNDGNIERLEQGVYAKKYLYLL